MAIFELPLQDNRGLKRAVAMLWSRLSGIEPHKLALPFAAFGIVNAG